MFPSFPIEGKNILDSHEIKFTELSYLPAAFLRLRVQTGPVRHKGAYVMVLLGTIPSLSLQKCDVGASPHRVSHDEAKRPFLTAERASDPTGPRGIANTSYKGPFRCLVCDIYIQCSSRVCFQHFNVSDVFLCVTKSS